MRLSLAAALAVVAALCLTTEPVNAARRKYGKPTKRVGTQTQSSTAAAGVSDDGSVTRPDPQQARKENDAALKLAQSGKLVDALPQFLRAMELDPANSEYINNVGVTEMRLGRLDSAMSRFKHALEIDPVNDAAQANLKDLQDYMSKSAEPSAPAPRQASW